MDDKELMIGLFAYDTGAVDSGIHDNVSKAELIGRLHAEEDIAKIVTEYATWLLSEEGKSQGYTLEDVRCFLDWLSENGYDV